MLFILNHENLNKFVGAEVQFPVPIKYYQAYALLNNFTAIISIKTRENTVLGYDINSIVLYYVL